MAGNTHVYYSEPCIRGHRATSCAHVDRVLLEVRKPGRPLRSCRNSLATCICGRLPDTFLVRDNILRPQPRSVSSQGQSKTKYFTLKQSRRGNRARTGSRSSTSLPSDNTQITEAVAMMKDEEQSLIFRKSHGSIQQSLREPSKSDTVISPDHSFPQPLLQDYQPTFFLPPITTLCTAPEIRSCPAKQDVGLTEKVLSPLFLEPQPTQLAVSLVRDEDISPMSNTKSTQQSSALDQGRAQAHIRF